MKYFSVPADFNKKTIDKYARLNEVYRDSRLVETYGNITVDNRMGSGRTVNLLPGVGLDELAEYAAYSREKNIDFNYTMNVSCMGNREFESETIAVIKTFLGELYEAGVRWLTVTMPSLIELIRSTKYDFRLKASTICQVTNPDKALAYKRMGVDRIVVDESVNRDFKTLERIGNCFGSGVEIIANVICYKNCIYRMFHYNQISGDSIDQANKTSCDFFVNRCVLQRYQNISNLLRINWIRPEDLHYYTGTGIDYFKLQGRQAVLRGDPVKALEYYFKEDYDGDLMELLDMFDPMTRFRVGMDNKELAGFIDAFYRKENFCKNDCTGCSYCETFAKKCIDFKKAEEAVNMAGEFYRGYDDYRKMLLDTEPGKPVEKLFQDHSMSVNFDFE
jgi:collagenase-like PrtC family protease